ncbi:hypothetical protein FPV67DRAFT_1131296 [Lyophyllum atratum]|nr:hypothetical protein FPV67DRAFT_1131296 [Lyophyllum atratum]
MLLPRMNRSTSSLSTTASKATVNDPDFECTDTRVFRRFLVVLTYLPQRINIIIDFLKHINGKRIDTQTATEKIVWSFDGDPDVIKGFNRFLPLGYHNDISTDPKDQPLVTVTTPFAPVAHPAGSYLAKVAHRYLDDRDTYKKVLDLFGMYATERLDTAEAYGQAQILLKDSPDLLAEFSSRFLTP